MTNYISKRVECEAFQVPDLSKLKTEPWLKTLPEWFQEAYVKGKVQITVHYKSGTYVSIDSARGGHLKAIPGMWICRNAVGVIFVMAREEFEEHFEELDDANISNY